MELTLERLDEPAGEPRGGGVAQGRGVSEPGWPEGAGVRAVARVEAGQGGAVGAARASSDAF